VILEKPGCCHTQCFDVEGSLLRNGITDDSSDGASATTGHTGAQDVVMLQCRDAVYRSPFSSFVSPHSRPSPCSPQPTPAGRPTSRQPKPLIFGFRISPSTPATCNSTQYTAPYTEGRWASCRRVDMLRYTRHCCRRCRGWIR